MHDNGTHISLKLLIGVLLYFGPASTIRQYRLGLDEQTTV